jgi:hypothetical protein
MKKNKRSFIGKCLWLVIPFSILLVVYFVSDPFMVLRNYKRYDKSCFLLNEHHVGWQTYINNRDSVHFNSFILGNSCSMAFRCSDWERYLDKGDRAIRLFGNAERLTAVYKKLKALDANHATIKNILLIADTSLLNKTQINETASFVMPPAESGMSDFEYQMCFVQSFFTPKYLIPYCDYNLFHHYRPYMKGVINRYGVFRNPVNCDINNPREKEIKMKHELYWVEHKKEFPRRDANHKEAKRVIYDSQIKLLKEIEALFIKHHANVRIVLSPDYNQKKLNHVDLKILQSIFGKANVYDFTGVNEFTQDIHNFYEREHYRPILGEKLLHQIYGMQRW